MADPFGTRPLWDMHVLTVLRVTTDIDEDRTRSKRWTGFLKKEEKKGGREREREREQHRPLTVTFSHTRSISLQVVGASVFSPSFFFLFLRQL